ncbi:sodium channel modifier 1 isoform X1 [Lepisosteus oculatus]|uniref:sodium channel modifier 1 isoform X1 n=1 Tax=Lepisosteus oculatus TaxID=7918 RepID=UPI0037180EE1
MSFKREGDDASQLNVLKKRRVADLLSNFIPEDEAVLMKNGRYACLVCSSRPVFDTVDMLAVHRKGKRHLEGLQWSYRKKRELQNEIEKRRHLAYVRQEEAGRQETAGPAPLLAQTRKITHHALLKSTPYNSCHQKRSSRSESNSSCPSPSRTPVPRNQMLQAQSGGTSTADTTPVTSLPGHHSNSALEIPREGVPERAKESTRKKSRPAAASEPDPGAAQRRQEMEHYLRLKSSGWLQDRSGNWVKDENVEFDSDEDQPPTLSPS